jgi:hypothetical protein
VDWARAIQRNSEALKGIIADLFAMLDLAGEATVARLPRSVHSAVLRVLRPAESAVRRLIVIAARGLVVKLAPARPGLRPKPAKPTAKGIGSSRPPSFQLFDPRKRIKPIRAMKSTRLVRASLSSRYPIPPLQPYLQRGQRALPPPPLLLRRRPPMAWPAPRVLLAGSRPSSQRSRICRARPNVSPAGSRGGRKHLATCSCRRSGPAVRRATAGNPFTKSMKCSSNAMTSPGRR